jgi:ketosteroid isomerase-like protein
MTNPMENSIAEKILQIEREIMAAIKAKDASALAAHVAGDFVYRTHFGAESNKDEFLQSIAAIPVEILSMRGEDLKVNVYGETAILTGVQRAEARAPEGEVEESAVAFTDVFVQREGRWLMVLAYGIELPSESDEIG